MTPAISESALRARARARGYSVHKSRRGESIDQLGGFMLCDEEEGRLVVLGSRFDATLADIAAFLAN